MTAGEADTRRASAGRRWGIGHLLVLLVAVALAPFVVLEGYRSVQEVERGRAAVADHARDDAQAEANSVDDYLRLTERYIATIAASPSVQSMDPAQAEPLFQAMRRQNPNYENVFLLAVDGRQVASTDPRVRDPDVANRGYFRDALSSGRMAASVVAWPGTGRSVVVLAVPVVGEEGQASGVLAIALSIARLSSIIGYVGLPEGSVVLLVQQDGTVIAASEATEKWVGQNLTGTSLFAEARGEPEEAVTGRYLDGRKWVAGVRPVERTGWLVLTSIPQAEVDAQVRRALIQITQEVALVLLATLLLSFILLRRVVAPIRVLSDGALAFAAGRLDQRIPLRRQDELGDLATTLNSMAGSLEERLEEEAAQARALQELNQLQSEFVATASHELRTPITAIRTYAEALLRGDITDETTRRECLEGIDRGSARLAGLARALLDASRIERGQVAVSCRPVAAAEVARAAIEQAAPGELGRTVLLDVEPELPLVFADPERLEDVLTNLLSNARKFSPAGSTVDLEIAARDSRVEFAVTDRGAGIAPAEQERIFNRFYQVQRGPNRRAGGSGLGLYIARAYVQAMQGEIRVYSEPGAGSTFVVVIPAATITATADEEIHQHAALPNRAGRR